MKTTTQVPVDRDRYARLMAPVRCYGCVDCQKTHAEGEPLFQAHHARQTRHGMYERPPTPGEVLRRLKEKST